MFEFKDITIGSDGVVEYYWYDLLKISRWNIRYDSNFKLAVL